MNARVVGAGPDLIVVEARVKRAQVKFVIDQVIERELEPAGLDLLMQHHRYQHAASLDRLVACHRSPRCVGLDALLMQVPRQSMPPSVQARGYCTVSTF